MQGPGHVLWSMQMRITEIIEHHPVYLRDLSDVLVSVYLMLVAHGRPLSFLRQDGQLDSLM
jgi:hypothetical protein